MKKQPFILFFVVVALVAATAAACVYMKGHRRLGRPGVKLVAQPSLDASNKVVRAESVALPEKVLDLTSQTWPIAADELQTLPADTLFGRRYYRAPDDFSMMLSVVLMGVDSRSIHKPEICLPAQGWKIQEEPATILVEKPFPYELPVMKVFGRKTVRAADGLEQTVAVVNVYWFVAENSITASHLERMWQMGENILRTGTLQRWAFISCSTFCSPGQEQETFERMKQFLAAAVPEFQVTTGPTRTTKVTASSK